MSGVVCQTCGWVHGPDEVVAVDRFNPNGPVGYRAQIPGARLRTSRVEAMRDVCTYRAGAS